jgi:hypothetical protein
MPNKQPPNPTPGKTMQKEKARPAIIHAAAHKHPTDPNPSYFLL